MQSRRGRIEFNGVIEVLLIVMLCFSIFIIGISFGKYGNSKENLYLGCWKKTSESDRAITIRVNDIEIEEILDTARHEICHEIHYRLNRTGFDNTTIEEREQFAETCEPENYDVR